MHRIRCAPLALLVGAMFVCLARPSVAQSDREQMIQLRAEAATAKLELDKANRLLAEVRKRLEAGDCDAAAALLRGEEPEDDGGRGTASNAGLVELRVRVTAVSPFGLTDEEKAELEEAVADQAKHRAARLAAEAEHERMKRENASHRSWYMIHWPDGHGIWGESYPKHKSQEIREVRGDAAKAESAERAAEFRIARARRMEREGRMLLRGVLVGDGAPAAGGEPVVVEARCLRPLTRRTAATAGPGTELIIRAKIASREAYRIVVEAVAVEGAKKGDDA